jgi:prophage regulatory protein
MTTLPAQDHLLTLKEVITTINLGRTTIYRLMEAGRFPRSVQLSPKLVRWWSSEVQEWRSTLPRTVRVSERVSTSKPSDKVRHTSMA